jgi:cyanuric acid amidohydrolase
MREAHVHRLSAGAPDDTASIEVAIADGHIRPECIMAILSKTEGNGCVNDFSRGLAALALRIVLERCLGTAAAEVPLVMSGGTEGGLAPHWLVFEARPSDAPSGPALAIGRARTTAMEPWEIGRRAQVEAVADAVRRAMAEAEIASPADAHYVQVKCPLLTAERIARAEAAGHAVATRDTLKSLGAVSRGGRSGRGAGVGRARPVRGVGDRDRRRPRLLVGRRQLLGRHRAPGERDRRSRHEPGLGRPASGRSCGDGRWLRRGARSRGAWPAGPRLPGPAPACRPGPPRGSPRQGRAGPLRGCRHTMLDDSDIAPTRHARALLGGVLGGLIGHGELFVSGGAEHQGPDGGGPVALIANATQEVQ